MPHPLARIAGVKVGKPAASELEQVVRALEVWWRIEAGELDGTGQANAAVIGVA
jgi:hypothetical protein